MMAPSAWGRPMRQSSTAKMTASASDSYSCVGCSGMPRRTPVAELDELFSQIASSLLRLTW